MEYFMFIMHGGYVFAKKKSKIMKASFLTIVKSNQFTSVLIREDKKVWINFGDDNWFEFEKLNNIKVLEDKKKYRDWLQSKKFKKNFTETIEIINNNYYEEIVSSFIKDFKKDRSNRIIRNDVEIDPNKTMEDMQYEFKK
jgi:hypothetical protein